MQAPRLFARRVADAGGAAKAAKSLGCTRQYIYLIIRGEGRPSLDLARRIEDSFGVPMRLWTAATAKRSPS